MERDRTQLPYAEPSFFEYLAALDMSKVKVYGLHETSFVFPREPIMSLEGPLGAVQMIESTLINLNSYPTLICTNAVRMRVAAGRSKSLIEFGLRRAQGPSGATIGAKYAMVGTFNGKSALALADRIIEYAVGVLLERSGAHVRDGSTLVHNVVLGNHGPGSVAQSQGRGPRGQSELLQD